MQKVGGIIEQKPVQYEQLINNYSLKYGFCSYFSLAILDEFPEHTAVQIDEYDNELQANYMVHIVLQSNHIYLDSLGKYQYITHSIMDISDIEWMNLTTKTVQKDDIKKQIINDLGHFDQNLYKYIRTYVREHYTKKDP